MRQALRALGSVLTVPKTVRRWPRTTSKLCVARLLVGMRFILKCQSSPGPSSFVMTPARSTTTRVYIRRTTGAINMPALLALNGASVIMQAT